MSKPSTADTTAVSDPFELFSRWMSEAEASEVNDPNAMAIATADATGLPDVRMVLLKHADADGFVFYTNTQSQKGLQLAANMQAAVFCTGNRCAVRFASGVRLSWLPTSRRMRISPPGRARAALARGQASSPGRLKASSRWKKPSGGKPSVSTSEQCPGLRIGQVTASARFIWSFGPTSPSACTTVLCIAVTRLTTHGELKDCIRESLVYMVLIILKPDYPDVSAGVARIG